MRFVVKWSFIFLFAIGFFSVGFFGTAHAARYVNCYAYADAGYKTCTSTLNVNDQLAYYSNEERLEWEATSPTQVYYLDIQLFPDVTRGDPVYETIWAYDETNSSYMLYDDTNVGAHLTDYSTIYDGVEAYGGYNRSTQANSHASVSTHNAPGYACDPIYCAAYAQSIETFVY